MAATSTTERKAKHCITERGGHKRKKRDLFCQSNSNRDIISSIKVDEKSPIVAAFRGYQKELDKKHDKYERLVKHSRDVTIQSKRVIFLLHRINSEDARETTLQEANEKLTEITKQLKCIALELVGEDPYQFLRAYTNGLQEYIEAVSFHEYLISKNLLTLNAAEENLHFTNETPIEEDCKVKDLSQEQISEESIKLHLPPMEYILGLADLTGELMRCCINSIGNGDLDKPFQLLTFMREMYEGFSLCSKSASRELRQKMETMRQSLVKVENTCYMLQVRGSEIPKHMLLDAIKVEPQYPGFQDR